MDIRVRVFWGVCRWSGILWLLQWVRACSLVVVSSFDFFNRRIFIRLPLGILCFSLVIDFQSITLKISYLNTASQNEMFGSLQNLFLGVHSMSMVSFPREEIVLPTVKGTKSLKCVIQSVLLCPNHFV